MTPGQARSFGAVLRRYRLAADLTQEALAERAGLSLRTIVYLEQDRRGTPRHDTLTLLVTALQLSLQEQARFLASARPEDTGPAAPAPPRHDRAAVFPSLLPLIGRQQVLARLEAHLEGEGPPFLLLTGEPGIGKTRLLTEVARRAVLADWTVLPGGCHRHGVQDPYAPLRDALQHHLAGRDPLSLRRALEGCAWLVQFLPELAERPIPPLPAGTLPEDQQRRLMFGAVQRCLANVAGQAGSLLLLDDLQWAGADALDLLASLLLAPRADRVRVVGAYRHTEVGLDDPLAGVVADLVREGLVAELPLGPLEEAEAEELLRVLLPGREGATRPILDRAGGVPFFLVSYAQALKQGSRDGVPWDLAQSVRQRVTLVPAAREILGAAAIIGRRVPRELLGAVVERPEEAVLVGLDAACAARLLLEEREDAYVFAHDVIREVVEADLGAGRRAMLHRKVAEALERRPGGAPAELLAYHYTLSYAQDKAVQYLELAGDQAAAQYAHAAAEMHYRDLLDRLEQLGRAQDAARVQQKLGGVLSRTGQYEAALPLLEEAAEHFRTAGDLESLTRVTVQIARACGQRGTSAESVARLRRLLETLDGSGSSPLLPAVYEILGHSLCNIGEYREGLAASERAIELAHASGDDRTRALAEWNRVNCLSGMERDAEAQRVSQEVLPLMEAVGDLDMLSRAHHDLAYMCAVQGAFQTGRTHIERALAIAEEMGDPGELALALALRGWLAFLYGDWEQARRDLEQAVALSDRLDRSWYSAYPLLFLARLCRAQGDWAAAAKAAGEAVALAEVNTDLQAVCWASSVMAECKIVQCQPEAAYSRLVSLLDRPGVVEDDATALLPVLAWAQLQQGQLEEAAETAERALTRARRGNLQIALVEALWVRGMVMLRKRCWQEAAHSIGEGLRVARDMPYPFAEARLLQLDGERLAAQAEPAGACERLQEALAIFQRLGAGEEGKRTKQALVEYVQHF